jgi:alkylresorcinol/alkylpyrone synthase
MGWDIGSSGFRIFLSPVVSDVIAKYLGEEIEGFLNSNQLTTSDIARWVCHSGGPKILKALENTLDLNNNELAVSWNSLADKGNLSSSAVIHILSDVMQGEGVTKPIPGTPGLLLAMGPGFSTELVLLEW